MNKDTPKNQYKNHIVNFSTHQRLLNLKYQYLIIKIDLTVELQTENILRSAMALSLSPHMGNELPFVLDQR